MPTIHHRVLTLLLTLTLALACSHVARADDSPGGPGGPGGEDFHGFMLTPTADAPAGATGFVAIHTGGDHPGIAVATHGLAVGTYTVNSTSSVDASVTALGTFDVIDFHPGGDDLSGGDDGPGGFGIALLPFPDGFDPTTIASIQVADSTGLMLLSGDNVAPSGPPGGNDHEHEHFVLAPTADAPAGAHGHAEIEVEGADDAVAATPSLKIETEGLDAGTYTVSVTSLADGTATVLGTFDVVAVASSDDGESDDGTEAKLPFPDGFDVTTVASVLVANADGVVLLQGDGTVKGGGIEGSEDLHEEVPLVATADAPAGATGEAKIKAHDEEGAVTSFLKIETSGLDPATYTVSVTSMADGSVTVLGTFDVVGASGGGDQGGDGQGDDNSQGNEGSQDGECDFGDGAALPFPAGFNPLDVGTVQIADANGVVLLTGDFSNVGGTTTTNFIAKVRITPGVAAPRAKGIAAAAAKVHKHRVTQSFTLHAKGVPQHTKFTLKINGAVAGTARSDATGHVVMNKLPHGIGAHRISSVVLENAAGQRVLSAHF